MVVVVHYAAVLKCLIVFGFVIGVGDLRRKFFCSLNEWSFASVFMIIKKYA